MVALLFALLLDDAHTVEKSIDVGGVKRAYRLHVPPGYSKEKPVALVLVFHGGGGDGRSMERMSKFSELSDKEGFIVVYPDAVERNWNDGRGKFTKGDDLAFMDALLDALAKEHSIDEKRVFATGISNGAIFSHYLAGNRAKRIAAIAPVVGGMAKPYAPKFKPEAPVAVLVIQGTDDPLVPYDGGTIASNRGEIIGTVEALEKWAAAANGKPESATEDLPDKDPKDGCTATRLTWKGDVPVVLIKIKGGGHTWPGGPQYLGERVIGKTCRDFDATAVIWEFFKSNARR